MQLQNKVIVITGASSGLGKELAKKVAAEGAKVALVARSEEKLKILQKEIGENASYFVCDIAQLSQVQETAQAILDRLGNVDILVNNAGIWTDNEIEIERPAKRKEAIDTNVLGNIQFTETFLPQFKNKNAGHIFTVISTSGDVETPSGDNTDWRAYGATKWALSGYVKALRDSLKSTKVKVSGFFPGGIDTNLYEHANRPSPHKQPWMMQIKDMVDIILFALTRPSDVLIEKIVVTKVFE